MTSKIPIRIAHDLSIAYTPGVAEASREIARNPDAVWDVTARGNWVAVITDGSAVLGLGDVGPAAALPVMEGKCVLFKELAGIDAFPLALTTRDTDEFIRAVREVSLSFGAINLEDIAAPRCFEIEERLKQELDIPVMHDDQHGTAVVVAAALTNALALTGRTFANAKFFILGAGAAGVAIARFLHSLGATDIRVADRSGVISRTRANTAPYKTELLAFSNPDGFEGSAAEGIAGRDVFIGVSGPRMVSEEMVASMAPDPIVFALANPEPEIMPDIARKAGAALVATGRSDFPNQINNVLAYPGIFRGTLDARAPQITEAMKRAAAEALARFVAHPTSERLVPQPLEPGVASAVAEAVRAAA